MSKLLLPWHLGILVFLGSGAARAQSVSVYEPYYFGTLAGAALSVGSNDGMGTAARFYWPEGIAIDTAGVTYVADTWNRTVRKITPNGAVTTLAGLAGVAGSADGLGSVARFNRPAGIAV